MIMLQPVTKITELRKSTMTLLERNPNLYAAIEDFVRYRTLWWSTAGPFHDGDGEPNSKYRALEAVSKIRLLYSNLLIEITHNLELEIYCKTMDEIPVVLLFSANYVEEITDEGPRIVKTTRYGSLGESVDTEAGKILTKSRWSADRFI